MSDQKVRSFFEEPVGQAFIRAVQQTIEMYFGHNPVTAQPAMAKGLSVPYDIAGRMHFTSHDVEGEMIIAFRREIVLAIYESMIGERPSEINSDVADCVGELANTVYGLAKAPLASEGYVFPMARPEVTFEVNKVLEQYKSLEIPFRFDGDKELSLILLVRRVIVAKTA